MKSLDFGKLPKNLFSQKHALNALRDCASVAESFSRFAQIIAAMRSTVRAIERLEKKHKRELLNTEYAQLSREWAEKVLKSARVEVEVVGQPMSQPSIYLGNHVSYVDIALLWSQVNGRFVAKSELKKWPVIGGLFERSGIVFVDRASASSRSNVGKTIAREITENGRSICLFPSGTTAVGESKPWKWGAFKIAHENNIPVQPFRLTYSPLREVAYIDDDSFHTHLFNLMQLKRVRAKIEFHKPVQITDPEADCEKWWRWSQEIQIV